MPDRLESAVGDYLASMHRIRSTGGGTDERSYYPALSALLNAIGGELRPRVFCVSELASIGAGHPDFGLYTASQCQKGTPRPGAIPERGVVEVKKVAGDTLLTAGTAQVSDYWTTYRLVLVTNYRDFLLIGEDSAGRPVRLESFSLAATADAFWEAAAHPVKSAQEKGRAFGEYLRRALAMTASLAEPRDVAWILASYARDALQRVESAGEIPALSAVRNALEEALGAKFEGERGEHFFRSTLVQTLFYGIFSAWVLWSRQSGRALQFDWRLSVWNLKVPMLRTLFQQLADPARLEPLGLVEVLDWTAHTLNRVDGPQFFARFRDAEAVQYFYEPFLEAFDPDLRQQLGVWYTPVEVVDYMVARVDKTLREDLGIRDGLAAENVYVLDPCCGTGAYLASVLRRIDATLAERGLGALRGAMLRKAATERVFGFEILPAPFVVSHLQVGLLLQSLDAALVDDGGVRAAVYLSNALTGWEPVTHKPLPFPDLEEERQRAEQVKQETRILVILGNPPYNGFAGMAVEEERTLSTEYRKVRRVRQPEGQGLNDLYVRFFRMAERRIAEKTGEGIVCFISNYSWLDGLSFTGMRERFLDAFDAIRIDCLNGDKYKTGKMTPDGAPDPSIFSTAHNREGIQVGTAIATLVRRRDHEPTGAVGFRHLWGQDKRRQLTETAEADATALYETLTPELDLGLPFLPAAVAAGYTAWPALPDLMPVSFPGVKTSRDEFLVAIDRETLEARLAEYFDPTISHEALARKYPSVMKKSGRYDPEATRDVLRTRGILKDNIVPYAYRPFDVRWVYWEPEEGLLDRPRRDYWSHVKPDNLTLVVQQKARREWSPPQVISALGCIDLMDRSATCIPIFTEEAYRMPNASRSVSAYLATLGLSANDFFGHIVSVLHTPAYRTENADALRLDWPRIPLPASAELLRASGDLGGHVADWLGAVDGDALDIWHRDFTRTALCGLAVPRKTNGGNFGDRDFALTAGWGHVQGGGIVMPARGRAVERSWTPEERGHFSAEARKGGLDPEEMFALLGETTFDVYLNDDAYWSHVPAKVWAYALGGYQVLKKWLSYRERDILGRALTLEEVRWFSEVAHRIAAILLLGPALDRNYEAAKADAIEWTGPESLHALARRHGEVA